MKENELSIKEVESILANEMSQEKIIEGEEHTTIRKYRMLTEDEIIRLKRDSTNWSDRMKEESNLLYKLKYSEGKITPAFIGGVIESLEASGDLEITSLGSTKFILFIAGKQPKISKDIDPRTPYNRVIHDQHENALKRLHLNFVILNSGDYSCLISKSGGQWVLSESQRNTLFRVTLKPNMSFWLENILVRKTKS